MLGSVIENLFKLDINKYTTIIESLVFFRFFEFFPLTIIRKITNSSSKLVYENKIST